MEIVLNLGDRKFRFEVGQEPNTGMMCCSTSMDELWLNIVGNDLYSFLMSNMHQLASSKLDDKKDFAGSTFLSVFEKQIFFGESALFHDLVFILRDAIGQAAGSVPEKLYVSIFSNSGEHYINIAVDGEAALIGCRLGDMGEDNKIIIR